MSNIEEKIKQILDRECYKIWHAGRCSDRELNARILGGANACWICHKNEALAQELAEILNEHPSIF